MNFFLRKIRITRLKEKYFLENDGLILRQLISHEGSLETIRIFNEDELKKATNNYHVGEILEEGANNTVYKGILHDRTVVAIKKPKNDTSTQGDQFVNEVNILSQINHKNVVKLLGYCVETKVPLLVYEYINQGTFYEHLFNNGTKSSFMGTSIEDSRRNCRTAEALAHLHSYAPTPIIHRDVKTKKNLDDNYITKVSDYGFLRLIPLNKSQLITLVRGTFGYLDPEYFRSHQLTEKSDVYSFGVVLAERLTSKVALSFARHEYERSLSSYFVSSMKFNRLIQILDVYIVNERNIHIVEQVEKLANKCLMIKDDERPTMIQIAMELERLRFV